MAKALHGTRDPVLDFLDWERLQEHRYEFHDGEVRMMVGAKAAHHRIVRGLEAALAGRLSDRACEVFTESLKLRVGQNVLYPDVFVVCRPVADDTDIVEDPVLVAEVLSPSTAHIDRGPKWDTYRGIAALRHYLLLADDAARVAVYTRDGERWVFEEARGRDAVLRLTHPTAMDIPLAEIYERTLVAD